MLYFSHHHSRNLLLGNNSNLSLLFESFEVLNLRTKNLAIFCFPLPVWEETKIEQITNQLVNIHVRKSLVPSFAFRQINPNIKIMYTELQEHIFI